MERKVLCGANAAVMKYYFNDEFAAIPAAVREELRTICVVFAAQTFGTVTLEFDEEGELFIRTGPAEDPFAYDEIGAGLKAKELRMQNRELFEALELFYKVFILKEPAGPKPD